MLGRLVQAVCVLAFGTLDALAVHTSVLAGLWALPARHHNLHPTARRDIKDIVEGPPQQLIEAVAERIAERVLREHPTVAAVTVGVAKPQVAVPGVVRSLGVEITRRRRTAEL